jgi:hypothetical protein
MLLLVRRDLKAGLANFNPTGGPHNSLRTRLRAALLCVYLTKGMGGQNSLERPYLHRESYAKTAV